MSTKQPRVLNPSIIDMLLHIYYTPTTANYLSSEAKKKEIVVLLKYELIALVKFNYECTERGFIHVELLLRLPLPKQAWVDSHNNIVNRENL